MDKKDGLENSNVVVAKESEKKNSLVNGADLSNKNNKSHSAEVLEKLGVIQERIDYDGLNEAMIGNLKELHEKEKSYFIKKKIERMLTLPLDELDEESKRVFIKSTWDYLSQELVTAGVINGKTGKHFEYEDLEGLDPLNKSSFNKEEFERFFSLCRDVEPDLFSNYEKDQYEFFYRDEDIRNNYRVEPDMFEGMLSSYRYYSRISGKFCALYDYDKGRVSKYFKLEEQTEKNIDDKKTREGNLQIRDLEDELDYMDLKLALEKFEYVNKYIYFRKKLPESVRAELDDSFGLGYLPDDLDKDFFNEDEFNMLFEKNRQEIKIIENKANLELLRKSLVAVLEEKYKTSAKENAGFKLDDMSFLDRRFSSKVPSLSSERLKKYMDSRQWLPDDLVAEFENDVPVDFGAYVINDYPFYNKESFSADMLKVEIEAVDPFFKLSKEVNARIKKVINSRSELKEVSLEDMLAEEGFAKDELESGKYEEIAVNYRALMELETRRNIDVEFGIKLSDFSVREQVQFANFMVAKSEKEVEQVKEFLNQGRNKSNRLKAFLSLEFGQDLSQNLFAISENIEPEQADMIFAKYAEIADLAYEAEREVLSLVRDKEKGKKIDPRKISQDLLKRGKDILVMFAEKIMRASKKGEKIPADEILSDLEDYQRDLVFHAAGVREGKKNGMEYEDFVGASFKVLTAREVFEDEKLALQMRTTQRKNWKHETPQFQKSLEEGLDKKINEGGDDVLFFVFEQNKKLTSFCRIDKSGYFGSLNTRPSMRGSALGWGVSEAAFKIWGKRLEAHSDPFDSMATSVYIEKDGFVAIGTEEYAGKYSLHILRENGSKEYSLRGKSQAEILNYHLKYNSGNNYGEGDEIIVLALSVGSAEMKTTFNEFLNDKHYVLTRYFFDKDGKTAYCGLERGSSPS